MEKKTMTSHRKVIYFLIIAHRTINPLNSAWAIIHFRVLLDAPGFQIFFVFCFFYSSVRSGSMAESGINVSCPKYFCHLYIGCAVHIFATNALIYYGWN